MIRGLVVAAPASGSGKTTVTLALLRHLRDRGVRVGSLKVGPDYIDPAFHAAASARACFNVDPWAMREPTFAAALGAASRGADLVIAEGVMGLFDGATVDEGSTADVAARCGWPVVLVVDASAMAASAAAVVHGFASYRGDVDIAGVVYNRVGSDRHAELLAEATARSEVPVLGCLRRKPSLALPDRHLGLVQAVEHPDLERFLTGAARAIGAAVDVDTLLRLARKSRPFSAADAAPCAVTDRAPSSRFDRAPAPGSATPSATRRRSFGPSGPSPHRLGALAATTKVGETSGLADPVRPGMPGRMADPLPAAPLPATPIRAPGTAGDAATATAAAAALPVLGQRIAVARDEAFAFAYPLVLDGWRRAGAEVATFSPLAGEPPPPRADAIYLPGGYPELHAGRLAAARRFIDGLRTAADGGATLYGECGGYMVLGESLVDAQGETHEMAGLLPVATTFAERRLTLGYRSAHTLAGGPLGRAGAGFRGHEFHYARVLREDGDEALFRCADARGRSLGPAGRRVGRIMGSFVHLIDRADG